MFSMIIEERIRRDTLIYNNTSCVTVSVVCCVTKDVVCNQYINIFSAYLQQIIGMMTGYGN